VKEDLRTIEDRIKTKKKRDETELAQTVKLVGPNWRACRKDQSYDLDSSIRWATMKNSYREIKKLRNVVSRDYGF